MKWSSSLSRDYLLNISFLSFLLLNKIVSLVVSNDCFCVCSLCHSFLSLVNCLRHSHLTLTSSDLLSIFVNTSWSEKINRKSSSDGCCGGATHCSALDVNIYLHENVDWDNIISSYVTSYSNYKEYSFTSEGEVSLCSWPPVLLVEVHLLCYVKSINRFSCWAGSKPVK